MGDLKRLSWIAVVFVSLNWSTSMSHPEFLDAEDARFTRIALAQTADGPVLHLEGLAFHSALGIKDVEVMADVDGILVNLRLAVARRGLSGRFAIAVPLPSAHTRVLFGPARVQVWPPAATGAGTGE